MIEGQYYTCRCPISFYNRASVYNVGLTDNINPQRFKLQFCHWKCCTRVIYDFTLSKKTFSSWFTCISILLIYTSYVYVLGPLTTWTVFYPQPFVPEGIVIPHAVNGHLSVPASLPLSVEPLWLLYRLEFW